MYTLIHTNDTVVKYGVKEEMNILLNQLKKHKIKQLRILNFNGPSCKRSLKFTCTKNQKLIK